MSQYDTLLKDQAEWKKKKQTKKHGYIQWVVYISDVSCGFSGDGAIHPAMDLREGKECMTVGTN